MLFAILVVAFALRVWGAFADLPYIYHPDEPQNIVAIQDMLANRDPNPHLFLYPSLLYYINICGALLFRVLPAWLSGRALEFPEPISIAMGATFAPDADAVMLYRSMSIAGGVLSVLLIYFVGKRARDVRTGLLAAALAAVSALLVADCRNVTPDSYVVLFELCALLASLSIATEGRRIAYVAAGVAIGAAAAAKYNGALVCLFPLAAHLWRNGFGVRASAPLWLCAGLSALTFAALNPYFLLDQLAASGVGYQFSMYSGWHQGMEGHAFVWYLGALWSGTGIASLLALAAIALWWRSRSMPVLVLAAFAIPYFVFISSFSLRNDRTLLPIVPCVLVLAAMLIVDIAASPAVLRQVSAGLRRLVVVILALGALAMPLYGAIKQSLALTTIDSRATARDWINTELPADALVAVESYAPFVDPGRFRVMQAERAIDHTPQWYVDQHADYLVLSQGMFGRYLGHTQDYPHEAASYRRLVGSMQLVKEFHDGGYSVLVLRVPSAAAQDGG